MSERNENKVYIIPPDFIQSGTLFGGLVRQYNQDTMLPIAENLSVCILFANKLPIDIWGII